MGARMRVRYAEEGEMKIEQISYEFLKTALTFTLSFLLINLPARNLSYENNSVDSPLSLSLVLVCTL
jgi:hypothetical protein